MEDLKKTTEKKEPEEEVSFKNFFIPFTNAKAVTWLISIGIIVFFNSLFNGFVWDDLGQIVNNDFAHHLSSISTYFFGTPDGNGHLIKIHALFYRPLMGTFFTLLYAMVGANSFFYHFLSLVMHIITSVLLFYLFRRFFKLQLSFFLTVLFLIHPLNSETVDYIGAYNDLMYAIFGMISLALLQRKHLSIKKLVFIAISLFLSLISKETGFLFIPILLAYGYFFQRKYFKQVALAVVAPVILYSIMHFSFVGGMTEEKGFAFSPFLHMSMLQHLLNVPMLFSYYIHNFVYPDQLAVAQQWYVQSASVADFYIPLGILLVVITGNLYLLLKAFKKTKEKLFSTLFFSLWFWIGMGLYLQLIPLDMTVADRWFYFPMIGLLGLLGLSVQNIQIKKIYRKLLLAAAIVMVIVLSIVTINRNRNWYSEKTLFLHDLQIKTIQTRSFDLENHAGMIYFTDHNYKLARAHYERSIQYWDCSDAQNNLGYLEQTEGNLQAAENDYLKAVQCNDNYKNYGNLVLLLYRMHKYDLTEQYTNKAIQKFPGVAGFYFILGVLEYHKGDAQNALKNLAIGYQLSHDPQIATAYQMIEQNKPVNLPL